MAESFTTTQQQFASYIRDPENTALPKGIEQRRMAIYRDLFFNNFDSTLSTAFPVIKQLHSPDEWQTLVRDFMIQHRCQTPLFVEISKEFISYLKTEWQGDKERPFMPELAHYEWVELGLNIAEAEWSLSQIDQNVDLMTLAYSASPLAWLCIYEYPVQLITTDFQPTDKAEQPVCMMVYRDAQFQIKFTQLNAMSARLFELISNGMTPVDAVTELSEAIPHLSSQAIYNGATGLIRDWVNKGNLHII
ncbi:MAG TPA: DUF2063 domain-containing protein [Methylophaga aminisulfidivorans]|uniref:DUF2063 domain-containing protein n=1 Tax=Methylophaga aminisulfidivorans TaxID=230105 RepID=A0A7C1VTS6_9GAMM|nr:DUF2063 domain-containing protein [Methylophaga aminisulfidivorans]